MALPTLDAVFASAADQPRRYMLSQWLVNELGSGLVADYITFPERYLWAKIAVAAGGTKDEAAYISLPKQYAWKAIYDAVSGSSLGTIDWTEKQALGHIAAAYRGDTANPANLATYIDWPWRYQVASIITQLAAPFVPIFPSDDLWAFWKLEDLTDSSGNGYDLTNTNDAIFVEGKIGNAVDSDGTRGLTGSFEASIPYSISDWTVSCWAKIRTFTSVANIIIGSDGFGGSPFIAMTPDGYPWVNSSQNWNPLIQSDVQVSADEWVHLVVTLSGSTCELWQNGISKGTAAWDGFGNAGGINIPLNYFEGYWFDGQVDAVGIWTRVLSESEINALYNNGNGLEP
jgi:hypothetical protein